LLSNSLAVMPAFRDGEGKRMTKREISVKFIRGGRPLRSERT
jgi:hypothetical protein